MGSPWFINNRKPSSGGRRLGEEGGWAECGEERCVTTLKAAVVADYTNHGCQNLILVLE